MTGGFGQTFNKTKSSHGRTKSIIYKPRIWDQHPGPDDAGSIKQKVLLMRETFQNEKKEKENKTESV